MSKAKSTNFDAGHKKKVCKQFINAESEAEAGLAIYGDCDRSVIKAL